MSEKRTERQALRFGKQINMYLRSYNKQKKKKKKKNTPQTLNLSHLRRNAANKSSTQKHKEQEK